MIIFNFNWDVKTSHAMEDSTTFIDHKKIKTFNKKFAWVEHLNAILALKVGNMNEPFFQSSNARGVGEWWSLELIYA